MQYHVDMITHGVDFDKPVDGSGWNRAVTQTVWLHEPLTFRLQTRGLHLKDVESGNQTKMWRSTYVNNISCWFDMLRYSAYF